MGKAQAARARAAFINFVIDCLEGRSLPEKQLVAIVKRKWGLTYSGAEHRLKTFLDRGWLPATRTEEDGAFVWRYRRP